MLGLFVVHLGFTTLERLRATQRQLASRGDALVSMRVARHVLRRELRNGVPGVDWWADADSLWLRAFRGTAVVCPHDSTTAELVVSYEGTRAPDPSKDSVLLLAPEGGRSVRALEGVSTAVGACGSASAPSLQSWQVDVPVPPGSVLARLFERGSYHVAASALRYRRGASGRQPLTPEVWSDTSALVRTSTRLGIDALPKDSMVGPGWSAFLARTNAP